MTKPKIELRKIKHSKSLSEETPAYTADVWIDGKLFCHVTNHGQGGPDDYHPPKGIRFNDPKWNAELEALNKRIGATFPKYGSEFSHNGKSYDRDLELVCHEMLDEAEVVKDLKRMLASKIVFQKPGSQAIWNVKKPKDATAAVKLLIAVKRQHGGITTLNEMAINDALAVYKASFQRTLE